MDVIGRFNGTMRLANGAPNSINNMNSLGHVVEAEGVIGRLDDIGHEGIQIVYTFGNYL